MEPKEKYLSRPWLKSYDEGVPSDITVSVKSLGQYFDEAVDRWKDKTAIIFYGKKISWRELKNSVDRFAHALHALGVKKGDTIAILLLNSPQFYIAFYAAMKVGAIVTPISPVYVTPEIKYQLEDSKAKHIICMDILWEKVRATGVTFDNVILTGIGEFLPAATRLMGSSILKGIYQKMAVPPAQIYKEAGIYQFQALLKKYPAEERAVTIDPKEDVVGLLYTGGTTGWPKGAMLTHFSLIANMEQQKAFYQTRIKDGQETVVVFGPFYHIAGLSFAVLTSIMYGFTAVVFTNLDLNAVLEAVEIHQATIFFGVPSFWDALKDYEKTNRVNWKRLKMLMSGADALLEKTAKAWERRTGTQLCDSYGMTETSPATHSQPRDKMKLGSFGIPIPSTGAAVITPDKDEFVAVGEVGELIINGPQLFKGYWNKPEATAEQVIIVDGEKWFRTGDLVHMDEDGYFYFYDRKKDIIKYKGYQVYARMVEEVVKSHPMVREVGVVGIKDETVGEVVKAYVVCETDARGKLTESDITEWCKDKIAHYMIPKVIEFRGEIPKTDIGKVSRRELREEGDER